MFKVRYLQSVLFELELIRYALPISNDHTPDDTVEDPPAEDTAIECNFALFLCYNRDIFYQYFILTQAE